MVSGGGGRGVVRSRGRGVLSLSRVAHISDISALSIDGVGDSLDTAVGKVDRVGSCGGVSVTGLSSVEGGLGVVVGYGIVVGVHRGLVRVSWGSMVSRGSMIRWSSVVNGGRGVGSRVRVSMVSSCIMSCSTGNQGKTNEGLK